MPENFDATALLGEDQTRTILFVHIDNNGTQVSLEAQRNEESQLVFISETCLATDALNLPSLHHEDNLEAKAERIRHLIKDFTTINRWTRYEPVYSVSHEHITVSPHMTTEFGMTVSIPTGNSYALKSSLTLPDDNTPFVDKRAFKQNQDFRSFLKFIGQARNHWEGVHFHTPPLFTTDIVIGDTSIGLIHPIEYHLQQEMENTPMTFSRVDPIQAFYVDRIEGFPSNIAPGYGAELALFANFVVKRKLHKHTTHQDIEPTVGMRDLAVEWQQFNKERRS